MSCTCADQVLGPELCNEHNPALKIKVVRVGGGGQERWAVAIGETVVSLHRDPAVAERAAAALRRESPA